METSIDIHLIKLIQSRQHFANTMQQDLLAMQTLTTDVTGFRHQLKYFEFSSSLPSPSSSPSMPMPSNPSPLPSLKCPRCHSTNTKFCYYNNYNHSQPRHLCKACRRHWTNGGVLRHVPVGGASRKAKRKAKANSNYTPIIRTDSNDEQLHRVESSSPLIRLTAENDVGTKTETHVVKEQTIDQPAMFDIVGAIDSSSLFWSSSSWIDVAQYSP